MGPLVFTLTFMTAVAASNAELAAQYAEQARAERAWREAQAAQPVPWSGPPRTQPAVRPSVRPAEHPAQRPARTTVYAKSSIADGWNGFMEPSGR